VKRSIKILFHSEIVTLTSPSKFLTGTILVHAHLQAVYYNCVKSHLNPMSRLGGVALTSPSLHTERISEYKLNYPPFQILDSNHNPSCTSEGSVLQLCKGSYKSNKLFRRSCAYKVQALLLFVKVQVELSPLPNFGQRPYFFMHICR
jgi:hypothetical protein